MKINYTKECNNKDNQLHNSNTLLIIFQGLQPPPNKRPKKRKTSSKIKKRYNTFHANITSRNNFTKLSPKKRKSLLQERTYSGKSPLLLSGPYSSLSHLSKVSKKQGKRD